MFQLHPKQGVAFFSAATEILYGGAAGSGKSHPIRAAAIGGATGVTPAASSSRSFGHLAMDGLAAVSTLPGCEGTTQR